MRVFRAQGTGGALLFNVTKQALNPGPDFGAYGASKAALMALMRQYALEHGGEGIRANAINPDRIRSGLLTPDMVRTRAEARGVSEEAYMSGNLLGREVTAEDVGEAFVFAALMRSTTGAILPVDGGNVAAMPRYSAAILPQKGRPASHPRTHFASGRAGEGGKNMQKFHWLGAVVVVALGLAACGQQEAKQPEPPAAAAPEVQLDAVSTQRVGDLVAINTALQRYYEAHGSYPATRNGSLVSAASPGAGENWIPGLTPEYIPALPRDPAGSTDPTGTQYMYASPGGAYKLIAHGTSGGCDANIEQQGIRRDPARMNPDGTCWAFGFWTDDMANY